MQKEMPSKELSITIKDNNYVIKFPNTGDFIDIQSMKMRISQEYGLLSNSSDYNAGYARTLIDMIATYNILIPGLKKDLNVEIILGLSMIESRELLNPYIEKYLPWFNEWMEIITKVEPKEDKKHGADKKHA